VLVGVRASHGEFVGFASESGDRALQPAVVLHDLIFKHRGSGLLGVGSLFHSSLQFLFIRGFYRFTFVPHFDDVLDAVRADHSMRVDTARELDRRDWFKVVDLVAASVAL
jgi:hypothetical protein